MILNLVDYRPEERGPDRVALLSSLDGVSIKITEKDAAKEILTAVAKETKGSKIHVLRFFFHGMHEDENPGLRLNDDQYMNTAVNRKKGYLPYLIDELGDLSQYFDTTSYVELHSCESGKGVAGEKFVLGLANLLKVRVIAATVPQYQRDARFEGDTLIVARPDAEVVSKVVNSDMHSYQSIVLKIKSIFD